MKNGANDEQAAPTRAVVKFRPGRKTSATRKIKLRLKRGTKATVPKIYRANIYPKDNIPPQFVELISKLEDNLKMPIWMLIQRGQDPFEEINPRISKGFFDSKSKMSRGKPIALLLDSPGGYARCAYQVANFLRKHCGSFIVVIPNYAKSAATLLSLGAERIILAEDAELGPLDAQFVDAEGEEIRSALDEVQSLERLFAAGLDAVDQAMQLVVDRTGKKIETVLSPVMHFVSEMMSPLLQKIDTVQYTKKARILKVAEEYAIRLLIPNYSPEKAKKIARHLVERYPEHGFVIDSQEAATFGLQTEKPDPELAALLNSINKAIGKVTIVGRLEEVSIK